MSESQRASGSGGDTGAAPRSKLGDVLAARRIQISPRYKNRQLFIDERGRGLSASVFIGLETRGRTNFEAATVVALETIYELPAGWLSAALTGNIGPLPGPGTPMPGDVAAALRSLVDDDVTKEWLDQVETQIVTADVPPAKRLAMWVGWQGIRQARRSDQDPGREEAG